MKLKSDAFYALICDDSRWSPKDAHNKLICGVFASKDEAKECYDTIQDCPCKHYIKKCKVTVEY